MNGTKHTRCQGIVKTVITTGRASNDDSEQRAIRMSRQWGLPYYPRYGKSLASVQQVTENNLSSDVRLLVVENDRLTLHIGDDTVFYYHPGMGFNRLRRVMNGADDWMIRAMELKKGDRLLDATAGLGSDLLVSSYVVGENGVAVGLESQLVLALIVSEGMKTYRHEHHPAVTQSLRRIRIIHTDYTHFLAKAERHSFDVVYFDPMFAEPVEQSQQMIPLRKLANSGSLNMDSLQSALRVANRRVVVKDRVNGPYVTSGWFDSIVGGRGSRIVFCIANASR